MCGFVHSIFFTAPLNVIGWLGSNSATIEWCAKAGSAANRNAAPIRSLPLIVPPLYSRPSSLLVCVIRRMPHLDRAVQNVREVVFLVRVFHDHVVRGLEAPRTDVRPVVRVR